VIAGTATAVSGRVANRHRETNARRREAESAQTTPDAFHGPAANSQDLVSRLHQLADLKAMGALTDKEFTAAKTRLLQE
jgi:putative oligomerization/nucleic acid binding protein